MWGTRPGLIINLDGWITRSDSFDEGGKNRGAQTRRRDCALLFVILTLREAWKRIPQRVCAYTGARP